MEAMLNDAISTINGYLWSYFIIFIPHRRRSLLYDDNEFCTNSMIKEMICLVINGAGSSTEKIMYPHSKRSVLVPASSCRCW